MALPDALCFINIDMIDQFTNSGAVSLYISINLQIV